MYKFLFYFSLLIGTASQSLATQIEDNSTPISGDVLNDPKSWEIINKSHEDPWDYIYDLDIEITPRLENSFIQYIAINCTPPIVTTNFLISFNSLESYPEPLQKKYSQLLEALKQIDPKLRKYSGPLCFNSTEETKFGDVLTILYDGEILPKHLFDLLHSEFEKGEYPINDLDR